VSTSATAARSAASSSACSAAARAGHPGRPWPAGGAHDRRRRTGRPGPAGRARGRPTDEGLADTPRRVAAAFAELVTPLPFSPTTFPNHEGYDELVVARSIPFASLCQHHLLRFCGLAHVGDLPGDRILGLSKLARVVELFARDLQTQERLTSQVAGWLQEQLDPRGVGVVLEAEHLCMTVRGVQAPGVRTVTSALRGRVRDDPRTRAEFLALAPTMRG
jgi:GTP cyclohydrolase I